MSQLSLFSADLTPPQLSDLGGLLAAHGQIAAGPDGFRLSIMLADRWRAEALLRECRVRDVTAEVVAGADERAPDGESWAGQTPAPGKTAPGQTPTGQTLTGQAPTGQPPTDQAPTVDIDIPSPAAASGAEPSPLDRPTDHFPDPRATGGRTTIVFRSERTSLLAALAAEWTRGAIKAVPAGLVLTPGLLRCWTIAAGQPAAIGFLLGLDPHAPDTYEPLAAVCAAAGLAGSLLGIRGGGPAVRIVGYRRCARLAEMIGTPPPEAPRGAFPALSH